jgi:hypothetical protein
MMTIPPLQMERGLGGEALLSSEWRVGVYPGEGLSFILNLTPNPNYEIRNPKKAASFFAPYTLYY